jgi:hypothetical protein
MTPRKRNGQIIPWIDGQDRTWQDQAACYSQPYNGFTEWPVKQQKSFCIEFCTVRDQCAADGVIGAPVVKPPFDAPSTGFDQGVVYGGLTPQQLHGLQVQRRKAAI